MAQAVATGSFADRIKWDQRIKPALIVVAIAAVAYLIGTYMVAPRMAAQQPGYLPASYLAMPLGSVTFVNEEGVGAMLPVRIADTNVHRLAGFNGVGSQAMDNSFMLYVMAREMTTRGTFNVDSVRAPLEFAAIDASGTVLSVTPTTAGSDRVTVAERHQWVLVAKAGLLERFGIGVGSTIDTASVRKF